MEYDNEKTGVLFKNDQKGNEKAPYYKGKITFGGVEYDLAAWVRESKAGNKFLSLKVDEPYKKRDSSQSNMGGSIPQDSDVPFMYSKY